MKKTFGILLSLLTLSACFEKSEEDPASGSLPESGELTLEFALTADSSDALAVLIDAGLDVNEEDEYGNPLLFQAVKDLKIEIAQLLIEEGADITVLGWDEGYLKCFSGKNLSVSEINTEDLLGRTPLHYAAAVGNESAAEKLIAAGFSALDEDAYGETPLSLSLKMNQPKLFELLNASENVAVNISVNSHGESLLQAAAQGGNLSAAEMLLENGSDVNASDDWGVTPLMEAAAQGDIEMMEFLIENGAEVSSETSSSSAVFWAVESGSVDALELLLQNGASLEEKTDAGYTLLHAAAYQNQVEMIEYLVQQGFSLTEKDDYGNDALLTASANGSAESVSALIELGADLSKADTKGRNALILAAEAGSSEIVETLIEAGIDADSKDKTERSAIYYAVSYSDSEIFEILKNAGADLLAVDANQNTLLHALASSFGPDTAIAEELISAGVDAAAENSGGQTALDIAMSFSSVELIHYLEGVLGLPLTEFDQNAEDAGDWMGEW